MMPRLSRLVLTIFLLFSGAILAVRLIGSTRASPLALLFSFPDGTPCNNPCLFGIRAGETRTTDAVQMLQTHPLTHHLTMVDWPFLYLTDRASPAHDGVMIAVRAGSDGRIEQISLAADTQPRSPLGSAFNLLPEPASLGDILSVWGSPNLSWTNSTFSTYSYGHTLINFFVVIPRASGSRLQERSPVTELGLSVIGTCPVSAYRQQFGPWLGLTTFQRYETKQAVWGWTWIDRTNEGVLCQP